MACLFAILGIFFPRLVIIILAIATDYLSHAYSSLLWPVLGFFFAPFTTLAYAFAINSGGVSGWRLAVLVFAILLDLGVIGGSRSKHLRKKKDKE